MVTKRARVKLEEVATENNIYFPPESLREPISTGCTVLDCALGGGFYLGRITNIVGDKSTSKTGLGTEAVINFLRKYPDGFAFYRETEATYDADYAHSMGLPLDRVDFGDPEKPVITVEDFARDLGAFTGKRLASDTPGTYVLDSLDALSDESEMERDIGEGNYGAAKAKKMSELFRTVTRKLERTRILLLIISQVRDKIGVVFGDRHSRSGGRALDFYASQILFLSHLKTLTKTISGIERPYGVLIRAKVKKNKMSVPFRECDFVFRFNFGIDDVHTSAMWLNESKRLDLLNTDDYNGYVKSISQMTKQEYFSEQKRLAKAVEIAWNEIEEKFKPAWGKYSEQVS